MANKIVEELSDDGIETMTQTTVKEVKKLENGKISVDLVVKGEDRNILVDTVLTAIGRDPNPESYGAQNAGI